MSDDSAGQVVAMGLLAVHAGDGVPEPVVEFINIIFNRCNITISDERKETNND